MAELPILFKGPMVRAILGGRKTQSRRVIRNPPCTCGDWLPYELCATTDEGWQTFGYSGRWSCQCCCAPSIRCPYGVPGDTLWVRETWLHDSPHCDDARCGNPDHIYYQATEKDPSIFPRWRSSIHMPHWASRITLRVTDVRVQRVQEISPCDCESEGIIGQTLATPIRGQPYELYYNGDGLEYTTPILAFRGLWGGFGWDANPWVWVVSFEQVSAT